MRDVGGVQGGVLWSVRKVGCMVCGSRLGFRGFRARVQQTGCRWAAAGGDVAGEVAGCERVGAWWQTGAMHVASGCRQLWAVPGSITACCLGCLGLP